MSNVVKSYVAATCTANNHRNFAKEKSKSIFGNTINQFLIMGIVFLVIGLLALPSVGVISQKYATVIANIMMYTIVSFGYCLLLGYAGLASLGSSCFLGIGAYCAFYLCLNGLKLPYILAIIAAVVVSVIIGLIIGFISLRIEGLFLAIVTLGLSEIIRIVLQNIHSSTISVTRFSKFRLFGTTVTTPQLFFVVLVMMLITVFVIYNIMRSPTGRNMLAMKNSVPVAQAFGVNLLYHRVLAFIIACVTAALTGVCYLSIGLSITPTNASDPALSLSLSLNVLAAVIIGGYKSLWGTFGGVVFVFGLSSLFGALFPTASSVIAPYMNLIIGVFTILIVMFYPGGFWQLYWTAKMKIKAAKAKREVRLYGAE